jgi:hypothetical protein
MSQRLEARAEILKLARLLERDPATLDYLADVPPEDIRALREGVTEVLFSAHNGVLNRLAAASRLLPTPLVAAIGERAFGATLSARMAGLLDPERAVDMAGRLPVGFLADVAVQIDPRRASEVIARIPPQQIAAISHELIARGEHVTMGRFVGHLQPAAIAAALPAMTDADLLEVAFVLENKDGLPGLIDQLPAPRLEGLIDAATAEGMWPEVLDLLRHLRDDQSQRLAELEAVLRDGVLEEIIAVARECGQWPQLLPLMPHLPPGERERVRHIVAGLGLTASETAELTAAGFQF